MEETILARFFGINYKFLLNLINFSLLDDLCDLADKKPQ